MMQEGDVISGQQAQAANAQDEALKWLRQLRRLSSALVLNVAGPRESKCPGIQERARSKARIGARGLAYHRIYINPVVAAAVRQKGGLGI